MLRVSLRLTVLLSVLAVLAVVGWPAVASANHHHIGGSGSGGGDDPNADCLLWGYIVVDGGAADRVDAADGAAADADAGMTDAGSAVDAAQPVDAATGDGGAGPPPGAVLVCLEHASLFGCDCSAGPAASEGWSLGAVVLVAAILLAARRRRRDAFRGETR
jgi:MYXO-CTERM domain-containing protein